MSSSLPRWATTYQCEIRQCLELYLFKDVFPLIFSYFSTWDTELAPFQKIAFDACVIHRLNTFITGPAGTGKTFLLESIVDRLRLDEKVIVTASTGIAAIMIKGQTLHSFAKLHLLASDLPLSYWHKIWDEVDVLVIDEISMITPTDFARLVRLWRTLGILDRLQVIILGDFFQLPAVVNKGGPQITRGSASGYQSKGPIDTTMVDEDDSKYSFCFQTPEWNELIDRTVYLHDVFRQSEQEFVRSLNAIRVGMFTAMDIERVQQRWVYHPHYSNDKPVDQFKEAYTWIYPTNAEADAHNHEMIDRVPGDLYLYESKFGVAELNARQKKRNSDGKYTEPSFSMYSSKDDVPSNRQYYFTDPKYRKMFHVKESLKLKKGIRVLLTVNLRTESGLVNGARGTIVDFKPSKLPSAGGIALPIVKFDNGQTLHVMLHEWQVIVERTVHSEVKSYCWMVQLPLRYAYATTTHQSQGQSLSNVVISLKKVFTFGQGYVALSRAKTLQDLHLLDPLNAHMFRVNPIVQKFYETLK